MGQEIIPKRFIITVIIDDYSENPNGDAIMHDMTEMPDNVILVHSCVRNMEPRRTCPECEGRIL